MQVHVAEDIRAAHPSRREGDEWLVVPLGRRVRGLRDGRAMIDAADPLLVWEPGGLVPRYAFAASDVAGQLEELPMTLLDELADAVDTPRYTCPWDALDSWLEEDTPVHVHPRDPYHRIDVRASSRRLVVEHAGAVLCDSRRPLLVFETGLPTRHYAPATDVRLDLLVASDTVTGCAYKGEARHWHAELDGLRLEDACWSYPYPTPEVAQLAGLVCFYAERVDLVSLDGVRVDTPATQWASSQGD